MDKQSSSTTAPESIGELSANIVDRIAAQSGREAPKPPSIDDLQADLGRLRSLVEIVDDLIGDITTIGMDDRETRNLFKAQNIASVTLDFTKNLDLQFDAYMAARSSARQEA